MRISLVRTGGVAGTRREVSVDTDVLDAARAERLRSLLEDAGLEHLASERKSSPGRPDRFRYALTVEDDAGRRREIAFSEEEASEALRGLVEAVWREGGTQPPGIETV